MLLAGICAMVTGGGRGIGRGVALACAQEGADVAVVSRTSSEVEQVAAEVRALARKGLALTADLTRREDADRAMRQAVEGLGKVDILVNNAGGYRLFTDALVHGVSFGDLTEAEWDRVIASNLKTTFLCCKAVLPHMVERGVGAVINMTSGASLAGGAGMAAYSAAKAGLDRLTESLAAEYEQHGIAVNSLEPGWVRTLPNEDYEPEVSKRMRLPEDIGPSALFLALQTPGTMTGQTLSAPEFDRDRGIERPSAFERLFG